MFTFTMNTLLDCVTTLLCWMPFAFNSFLKPLISSKTTLVGQGESLQSPVQLQHPTALTG
jgi:hypothetical protein